MAVYLSMYKGRKRGRGLRVQWQRFQDWLIRKITNSPYSHCEIAVGDTRRVRVTEIGFIYEDLPAPTVFSCYSASARDGGVRCKIMQLPADQWDLIPLSDDVGRVAEHLYRATYGEKYDWQGAIGAAFGIAGKPDKWFCSEWCAAVLFPKPAEKCITPAALAERVKKIHGYP